MQTEFKIILLLPVLAAAFAEALCLLGKDMPFAPASTCLISAFILGALYSGLFHAFLLFAERKAALVAVAFPALLLVLIMLKRIPDAMEEEGILLSYGLIAGVSFLIWFILHLIQKMMYVIAILCLATDAVMACAYFTGADIFADTFTGKLIYVVLFILSADCIRNILFRKDKKEYPFAFFVFLMICMLIIPVRKEPINWKPVIDCGQRLILKTKEMARSVSYYFSELSAGSSYLSGYSSFTGVSDSITLSDRVEIEVSTTDNTSLTYEDEESGKMFKRRRTVYLTGGRGYDPGQFLDILFSFYTHNVDASDAYLFSRISGLDVSYVFLKTNDEIMPENTIKAVNESGRVKVGRSDKKHKKGYSLKSQYLDLDTGSPYLAGIMTSPSLNIKKKDVSYKKMSSYAFDLYGIRLAEFVSEDDYANWQADSKSFNDCLEIKGAGERIKELALSITDGYESDYEKCRAVEEYLRQYSYNTSVSVKGEGNTKDTEGLSSLADDFLFETGQGYCVHFSSAMVMLLRLNGIPARFVTGYRYVFPFDRMDSYEVEGRNAHAWVEAYIEGFGWVGFEPTPAMASAQERTWHRHPKKAEGLKEGYYEKEGQYKKGPSVNIPYPTPAVDNALNDEKEKEGRIMRVKEAVRLLMIILSAALLMTLLIIVAGKVYRYLRYKTASSNKRLIMDVSDIKAIITQASGGHPEDRGVLSDYSPYIPERFRTQTEEVFSVYYRIMYRGSGKGENGETVSPAEEISARELRKNMKYEMGRRRRPRID